jgi:cell division septation protein DedD
VAESHEPSYYEIALTNRQVIVAFVILLVCLLSAFFSGVWIGRESAARTAEEQVVRNTPPAQPKEGQNLEELEFFDSRNKKNGKDREETPASQTAADTTLLEDLGGSEPAPETTVPPPGDEPAAQPDSQARQADEAAAEATGTTTDNETPAERRRKRREQQAAAQRAAQAAAEPAIPKGSVVIQVFSSADQSQADRIRNRLAGGGYQAYLSPVEVGGHTMYRVRLGPFKSRDEAQKTAEKVRKGYKLDTWVTE